MKNYNKQERMGKIFGLSVLYGPLLCIIALNLSIFIFAFTILLGLLFGNFWFNEEVLMKKINLKSNITIVEIVDSKRGFLNYGEVIFEDVNGNLHTYKIDSDILWNISLIESEN
jgi:hypothetical protein